MASFKSDRYNIGLSKKAEELLIKDMQINTVNPDTSWNEIFKSIDFGEPVPEDKGTEEWVWITGYKGTDKDMKCRDYQFELGKQFDMPDGEDIVLCHSGFHLCQELKNVFPFYHIGSGNRFFEVKALVRRYNKNGTYTYEHREDKMTSKSIVFVRELSVTEIFDAYNDAEAKTWSEDNKKLALLTNLSYVRNLVRESELVAFGYSEAFAAYTVKRGGYEIAKTMATMPDVSMDVKVMTIMLEIHG